MVWNELLAIFDFSDLKTLATNAKIESPLKFLLILYCTLFYIKLCMSCVRWREVLPCWRVWMMRNWDGSLAVRPSRVRCPPSWEMCSCRLPSWLMLVSRNILFDLKGGVLDVLDRIKHCTVMSLCIMIFVTNACTCISECLCAEILYVSGAYSWGQHGKSLLRKTTLNIWIQMIVKMYIPVYSSVFMWCTCSVC
jgi:hypothetical protein